MSEKTIKKLKEALKSISEYSEMKPEDLAKAAHMLTLIGVIASETLKELEVA